MKTKIIATIGPASDNDKTMKELVEAGASVFRLNTKYGSKEQYMRVVEFCQKNDVKSLFDVKFMEILEWLKTIEFDYFALSFATSRAQVEKIRSYFAPRKLKVIAKIESDEGIEHLDELIECCEGIMVARGDLGRNIPFEKVPIEQKIIIHKCNEAGKLVVTATEMLLSMTDSKIPERAESSDVANAILDGSDYLMLSEETAIGKYPVLAVETMMKVIKETEKDQNMLEKSLEE
ncbi:MAG: pyruvate kinase [Candidatus Berkelbacteria bacterium]|nr:pyruvate kinase [Candidatus Berkelbacteria bacterium]